MKLFKHESKELEPAEAQSFIRVESHRDSGTLVVKAELPGIDPAKDVEVTVSDGMLHIAAERREEERSDDKGVVHHELRYASFARTMPLPDGVTEADVKASYKDGVLEIRVPAPEAAESAAAVTKVPVTTA